MFVSHEFLHCVCLCVSICRDIRMTGTKWNQKEIPQRRFFFVFYSLYGRMSRASENLNRDRKRHERQKCRAERKKKRLINRSTHWKITCVTIVARQLISILARVFVLIIVASSNIHTTNKSRNNVAHATLALVLQKSHCHIGFSTGSCHKSIYF